MAQGGEPVKCEAHGVEHDDGLRHVQGPGKFEGELLVAPVLYEGGNFDEEAGNSSDGPGWAGLVKGPLTEDDLKEAEAEHGAFTEQERRLLTTMAGAIVEEATNGFVSVTFYEADEAEALKADWSDTASVLEPPDPDEPGGLFDTPDPEDEPEVRQPETGTDDQGAGP